MNKFEKVTTPAVFKKNKTIWTHQNILQNHILMKIFTKIMSINEFTFKDNFIQLNEIIYSLHPCESSFFFVIHLHRLDHRIQWTSVIFFINVSLHYK